MGSALFTKIGTETPVAAYVARLCSATTTAICRISALAAALRSITAFTAPPSKPAAGHLGRAAPNKATLPHAQNKITKRRYTKWHGFTSPPRQANASKPSAISTTTPDAARVTARSGPPASYSNDLTKSNAENTRIFEQGMAALDNENRR